MWPKEYKDYPKNAPLKKERVSPLNGIIGCEMCEQNGWGDSEEKEEKEEDEEKETT